MAQNLQAHIYLPLLQSLDPETATYLTNKEDRLNAIIRNIKSHQDTVRKNILQDGIRRQNEQQQKSDHPTGITSDVDDDLETNRELDHSQLLANLEAPYVEDGRDPCLAPDAPIPKFPEEQALQAAFVPLEIQQANETLEQLDFYGLHARQTLEFYTQALERQKRQAHGGGIMSTSTGVPTDTPGNVNSSRDPRRKR